MSIEQLHQFLTLFRTTVADRPIWLFLGLFVLARVALFGGNTLSVVKSRQPASVAASSAIVAYLTIVFWYLLQEPYYDLAEPTIAAVGWMFHLGQPVYHAMNAAERYSHIYGPLAFILPAWFLAAAGPSILTSKLFGVAAGVLTLAGVYLLVRRVTGRHNALLLTGFFAVVSLMHKNVSFWMRPDPLLALLTVAGLLAARSRTRWVSVGGVGVSAGMLLNLKFTGILYAFPALGWLTARFGSAAVSFAAIVAAGTALLPFVLFENVSLDNYLLWIRVSAANGLVVSHLRQNVEWAIFLLIPLAPTLLTPPPSWLSPRERRWIGGGLVMGLVGTVLAASKPGAGAYHLLPFWPIVIYLVALHMDRFPALLRADRSYRAGRLALLAAAVTVGCVQQAYFISVTRTTSGLQAASDLADLASAHAGRSIAMGFGYGEHGDRLTYIRPLLVFRTGAYLIDPPAIQEYQLSGLAMPDATLEALRRCRIDMWVFPRGARPFDGMNRYPITGHAPLFPDDFKRVFLERYEHAKDTRYFHVWSCRAPAGG